MAAHLDAAAGVPLHPVAREALAAALADGWADPDRRYSSAGQARLLLDAARESMAESLGARPDEISFAANGTQALHAAVLGALAGNRGVAATFVHSAVEHSAVLHAAQLHAANGGEVISVPVDRTARVDVDEFVASIDWAGAAVAALQAGNHEVGTRQPASRLAAQIPDVPLVVDGTHAIGHDELPAGWSVLAGDARMWGGPDLGVLAVRTGVRWRSPFPDDDHEGGRVPGVPNIPAAVAAAASLRAVLADRDAEATRTRALVDHIRTEVSRLVPDVEVLGDPVDRLPHIVTFSCLYADGEALLAGLDRRGFAVSSGSSCTASTLEPSHVLVAMGALTSGNIRVSLHPGVSADDVEEFLIALPEVVAEVRAELGAAGL
ncbi:MAG TPA: aminotransferase class V-fold PLP-dependent enzyme [Jatrophihabitantaceae bacterium]|nr:aminotransferase class V-fold PLP-dependent enzyme [Jatrophihabitantaceae bacterium]